MGLIARIRALARPELGVQDSLVELHGQLERLAVQLRAHAERVPYPRLARTLLDLAERGDRQSARLASEIARLGGRVDPYDRPAAPVRGRNYWERLSHDLQALRDAARRHREVAHRWDPEFPQTTTLLEQIADEIGDMGRIVGDLIARSDPHAGA